MNEIQVHNGQNLIDLALIYYGTAQTALYIAIANNIQLTDDLTPGQILLLPESIYIVPEMVTYYTLKKILPATAEPLIIEKEPTSLYGLPYSL